MEKEKLWNNTMATLKGQSQPTGPSDHSGSSGNSYPLLVVLCESAATRALRYRVRSDSPGQGSGQEGRKQRDDGAAR